MTFLKMKYYKNFTKKENHCNLFSLYFNVCFSSYFICVNVTKFPQT